MKKIFFALISLFAICLLATGCSDSYEKLNQKVATMDGQTEFSQEEVGQMIDYLIDNVDGVMTTTDPKEKLEKYPYFANFISLVTVMEMRGQLSSENEMKFIDFNDKYSSYFLTDPYELELAD